MTATDTDMQTAGLTLMHIHVATKPTDTILLNNRGKKVFMDVLAQIDQTPASFKPDVCFPYSAVISFLQKEYVICSSKGDPDGLRFILAFRNPPDDAVATDLKIHLLISIIREVNNIFYIRFCRYRLVHSFRFFARQFNPRCTRSSAVCLSYPAGGYPSTRCGCGTRPRRVFPLRL